MCDNSVARAERALRSRTVAILTAILTATLLSAGLTGCGAMGKHMATGLERAMKIGAPRALAAQLPVSDEEEREFGGAIAVMIVQRYGGLVDDPKLHRYVGLVGNAVAAVSSRANLQWHFGVLNSDEVNAVSAPGGYVFITRGALKRMKSEAELAGVLAHEVSHVTERHAVKIIRNLKSANALTKGASSAGAPAVMAKFSKVVDGYLKDYLEKGMPRDTEFAADKLAVTLLARIGYRTTGLRSFLVTMAAGRAGAKDKFYDTHPDSSERIRKLDAAIAKMGGEHGESVAARFLAATGRAPEKPATTAPERPSAAAAPAEPAGKSGTSSGVARPTKGPRGVR